VTVLTASGADLFIDGVRCEAFDSAPTRDDWYTPWGGPPSVRTWSVAPDTGALFVNVHVGGILRSLDGGASWSATLGLDHDVHEVVALAGGVVLAACGDGGLAVSRDGGDSWSLVVDGLRARYARAVCVTDDGWVLLSASRGPGGQDSAVYRRPLDARGASGFEVVADGLDGNVDSGRLTPSRFETERGTVYLSDDGGASWRRS
jgi:photosystem II stability/assembly factor-like uncharacterized protein